MNEIDDNVFLNIIKYLDPKTIAKTKLVNKRYNSIINYLFDENIRTELNSFEQEYYKNFKKTIKFKRTRDSFNELINNEKEENTKNNDDDDNKNNNKWCKTLYNLYVMQKGYCGICHEKFMSSLKTEYHLNCCEKCIRNYVYNCYYIENMLKKHDNYNNNLKKLDTIPKATYAGYSRRRRYSVVYNYETIWKQYHSLVPKLWTFEYAFPKESFEYFESERKQKENIRLRKEFVKEQDKLFGERVKLLKNKLHEIIEHDETVSDITETINKIIEIMFEVESYTKNCKCPLFYSYFTKKTYEEMDEKMDEEMNENNNNNFDIDKINIIIQHGLQLYYLQKGTNYTWRRNEDLFIKEYLKRLDYNKNYNNNNTIIDELTIINKINSIDKKDFHNTMKQLILDNSNYCVQCKITNRKRAKSCPYRMCKTCCIANNQPCERHDVNMS